MKRLLLLTFVLCLFAGCFARDGGSSSDTPQVSESRPSSSQSDALPDGADASPSVLGIDPDVLYDVFEELEDYPELVAHHIDLLVGSGLENALDYAQRAIANGLDTPTEDFSLEQLIQYSYRVYERENPAAPTDAIPSPLMREAALYAYADKRIADILPYAARLYDDNTDTYGPLIHTNYGFTGRFFTVEGEDDDAGRLIKISFFNEDEKLIGHTYADLLCGEDGVLRLRAMWQEPIIDYEINISGEHRQIAMSDTLFDNLIGGIDNRAIACEAWGRRLVLTAFDIDTLTVVRSLELSMDGTGALNYTARIRDGLLYLYFDDCAMILDSDLGVLFDETLPDTLQVFIKRGTAYNTDATPSQLQHYFGGYELASDLSNYIYTTEDGLWRYDLESRTATLLAPHLGDGGRLVNQINHFNPRYSTGDTHIFTSLSVYEGPGRYFQYEVATGQTHDHMGAAIETITQLPVSDFGRYFGLSYEETLTLGANHYIIQTAEYRDGAFDSVFAIRRGQLGSATPDTTITVEGPYTADVGAIMPDGRIILRAGRAYIGDMRYYILT